MQQDIDKKIKMRELRIRLLEQMKSLLEGYKVLGDEELLEFAKELGRDSEIVKKRLEELK